MLDLRQLACFAWACRCKSISRAAENMFVSQQAVSHSIRELEKAFGGPLLERFSGGVAPTALGQALLQDVENLLADCTALEDKAAFLAKKKAGLSLCYANGIFNVEDSASLDELCQFTKARLNTSLSLLERTTQECAVLLESGQADLLCAFNPRCKEGYAWVPLRSYPVYIAMGPNHPLAKHADATVADYQRYLTIIGPQDSLLNSVMAQLALEKGSAANGYSPSMQLSAFANIMRRDNSFLMFTLPFLHAYAGSDAVIRPYPGISQTLNLCVVYRKSHSEKAKIAKIITWLKECYRDPVESHK